MPLCLNIGAGQVSVEGYDPVDRRNGDEAYPLTRGGKPVEDGSVQEILASHILEHFSHREIRDVLQHWCDMLAPGGRIRIAVPNFKWAAKRYLAGETIPLEQYLMGSHEDENDFHKCLFDRELLTELMIECGLEDIRKWHEDGYTVTTPADRIDCSSLEVSLNLQGRKPISDLKVEKTSACMSAARFGPTMHHRCAHSALEPLHVPYSIGQGAYWGQVLTDIIEKNREALPDDEFIITFDYDTIFDQKNIKDIYRLMRAYPEADAICSLQSKRGSDHILFSMTKADGTPRGDIPLVEFTRNILPIATGHFGLTIFRTSCFEKLSRPWFLAIPDADGRWGDGKVDADIYFWRNFQKAGLKLFLAPRVVVGHMEEVVTWPDEEMKPVHQKLGDWMDNGPPKGIVR